MVRRKRTEEPFRAAFEGAPNGVMVADIAGRIILANPQVETMFGYAHDELTDQSVEVLVPVRFRHGHTDSRKAFSHRKQMRLMGTGDELYGIRKDGSEFAVEIGLNSAVAAAGHVVIATIVDVTGRKRASDEDNADKHARETMQVCQQLGLPAAILRHDGQIVHINGLLKELRSQFVFRGDRIGLSDSTANAYFKQALDRLGSDDRNMLVSPSPVIAADGCPPLTFHLLPMKGSPGSSLGILVVTSLGAQEVPSATLVEKLFSLAPAEARVAALIGSGLSPRQAAKKLGISEGTVRTTLKHVFTTVGVSRQSELAILLTKLTLR